MKKIFISIILILFFITPALAEPQVNEIYQDLQNIDQKFFESSIVPLPEVNVQNAPSKPTDKYTDHMPFFKKTRVKIQEALKARDKRFEEKQKLKAEELAKKEAEKEKTKIKGLDIKYLEYHEEADSEDNQNKEAQVSDKGLELVGGVKEQVTEKEMLLDCDEVRTDESSGDIHAIGNPILILPTQNVKLTADKMVYNRDSNILKAIDNVVLTKDGKPVFGDYIQINMNEENILMDNIETFPTAMKIRAKKAYSDNNQLILTDGTIFSETSNKFEFVSRMIGPDFRSMIISDEDKSNLISGGDAKLRIAASEVNIKAGKEHDVFQVKDSEVYYNDKYLFTWPSFTAYTNKKREYFEANYPEFGSVSRFGMFAGPGLVVEAPFGSTLKLIPLINYNKGIGFGGAAKFKSAFNETQFMYGSAADNIILRGKQQLDENLFLQYGANAYMDDWFLGRRRPKYVAELVYDRSNTFSNFLAENKDLRFRHRISAAYAQDSKWNMYSEHIQSSGIGTTRFRYMAEVDQSIFKYEDKENLKSIELSMALQGSAAVYGTGDTQFIGRIGPRLHTQYKYWMQDITYYLSAYSDQSPMQIYDSYRYGHSNVYIREAIRLNRYLSVGWSGSVTLTGDSPNGKLFQENAFIVSLGPDDLKINLGYDFMRRVTYFTIAALFDAKNTTIDFDKMVIKNPERLGQSEKKEDKNVAFEETSSKTALPTKLKYAEVIDIEDPDKESI